MTKEYAGYGDKYLFVVEMAHLRESTRAKSIPVHRRQSDDRENSKDTQMVEGTQ